MNMAKKAAAVATAPVVENVEAPVVHVRPTREECPSEYIPNKSRFDKLRMTLLEHSQEIEEVFKVTVRFIPEPKGVLAVLDTEGQEVLTDKLQEYVRDVIAQYEAQCQKVFLHYADFLQIRKRNAAELKTLEEDYKKTKGEINDAIKGFDYCYTSSFETYARSIIEPKMLSDGTFKAGDKSVRTLYGEFGYRALPGLVDGKQVKVVSGEEFEDYCAKLYDRANYFMGNGSDMTEEEVADRDAAAAELAKIPVACQRVARIEVSYKLPDVKAVAEKLQLPGFSVVPADPIGDLYID
jgi:hypothetical protein